MKILVIHASAGAGHRKAAEAICLGLKNNTSYEAVCVDSLDYGASLFKILYRGTYNFLISRLPFIWRIIFDILDRPSLQKIVRKVRRIYNYLNVRRLHQYLKNEKFDCIISTHFMASEISASLKRKGLIHSKLITVITDYDAHRIWLADGVDMYCVACEYTRDRLKQLGIEENKIAVTGIPNDERFSASYDISSLKDKLGLKKDIFTILVATGSFGIGPIEQIVKALDGFQTIVVCGHNKTLFRRLEDLKLPLVKVFGLVDNMHELMAASDVMVTKPGGLSITEALVSQLPLVFFSAIPGQEINNIKVLKHYGIGISDCSIQQIADHLNDFRSSKDAHLTALKKTKALARPSAVKDIINLIKH